MSEDLFVLIEGCRHTVRFVPDDRTYVVFSLNSLNILMRMSLIAYITCLFQVLLISNSCYFEIITCRSWWYKSIHQTTMSGDSLFFCDYCCIFNSEFPHGVTPFFYFMYLWECHSPFMVSTTSYNLRTGTLLAALWS